METMTQTRYTVFNYYRTLAVFESLSYDEALQVAKWDAENMGDPPEQRIVALTVAIGGYQNGGYFRHPTLPREYRQRLNDLDAQHS